jgi:MFS transporter, DHA1 family, multidrug resistance protein
VTSVVDWRRNLAALWLAEFTAILGFSFAFPFLPLFLHRELGIVSQSSLAFWSGIVAGASGISMAVASPVWGWLADRFGRRPMLIRAMVGGGVTVGLMGLARSSLQLAGLRFLQGGASGTVASASALVAAETPREHVAWALGVLSSAIALGSAVGPAAGGIAASRYGLRAVFLAGGLLLLLAVLPVLVVVRESPGRRLRGGSVGSLARVRAAGPGTARALTVLIAAQALMQMSYSATQQLVVLRLIQLTPQAAPAITGITFGAAGLATALVGVSYVRVLRLTGYRRLIVGAALLLALGTAAAAPLRSVGAVVVIVVAVSVLYGALTPALSSMIGLEAPMEVAAGAFGLSASAIAVGFGGGPLLAGLTASAAGVDAGLLLAGAIALALTLLLALASREPDLPRRGAFQAIAQEEV